MSILLLVLPVGCLPRPYRQALPAETPAEDQSLWRVEVSLDLSQPRTPALRSEIEWLGTNEVEAWIDSLPRSEYSMILHAVVPVYPQGPSLQRIVLPWIGSPVKTTLAPGEPVVSHIPLEHHFEGFASALSKHDILLFWSYETPQVSPRVKPERFGGMLVIPQAP